MTKKDLAHVATPGDASDSRTGGQAPVDPSDDLGLIERFLELKNQGRVHVLALGDFHTLCKAHEELGLCATDKAIALVGILKPAKAS